ncbi:MAG: hypothetical protein J7K22_02405 [Nanoarchaeota archaeon]|nr:hypothetical protein [Nanoarchaeota archaeon]
MKSQISIEFITGVTILLFIYAVTIGVFSSYTQHNIIETEGGRQACYIISTGIDSAVIGGNNFAINITLPYYIENNEYTILVNNDSRITIDWDKGISSCTITTQNITKALFKPCKISINNINQTIFISYLDLKNKYNLGDEINITGKYYFSNISLTIKDENNNILNGFPKEIETQNNEFSYIWIPDKKGEYIIEVKDVEYPTFCSQKKVIIE